ASVRPPIVLATESKASSMSRRRCCVTPHRSLWPRQEYRAGSAASKMALLPNRRAGPIVQIVPASWQTSQEGPAEPQAGSRPANQCRFSGRQLAADGRAESGEFLRLVAAAKFGDLGFGQLKASSDSHETHPSGLLSQFERPA